MTRTIPTAALALLVLLAAADGPVGQENRAATDKPPTTTETTGMAGDRGKAAESAPSGPDAKGTTDVSPGVGAVEGADGMPPMTSEPRR